jgi:hypothetical protein
MIAARKARKQSATQLVRTRRRMDIPDMLSATSVKPPSPSAGAAPSASGTAETAAPARNFTVPVEQRLRVAAGGLPAYIRRKRAIEDLRESILRELAEHCAVATSRGMDPALHARTKAPARDIERLCDLVARHNRWYPIEANLPIHPRTGELVERTGEPWRPMHAPTLEELVREAVGGSVR